MLLEERRKRLLVAGLRAFYQVDLRIVTAFGSAFGNDVGLSSRNCTSRHGGSPYSYLNVARRRREHACRVRKAGRALYRVTSVNPCRRLCNRRDANSE